MNKAYFKALLLEPSTWRGIALLLTSFGLITHDQAVSIEAVGLAVVGAIGAFVSDRSKLP